MACWDFLSGDPQLWCGAIVHGCPHFFFNVGQIRQFLKDPRATNTAENKASVNVCKGTGPSAENKNHDNMVCHWTDGWRSNLCVDFTLKRLIQSQETYL